MIRFNIYAIGRVGDFHAQLNRAMGGPDKALILRLNDQLNAHQLAEQECRPPICSADLVKAIRRNGVVIAADGKDAWSFFPYHFDHRSVSSADAMMNDLSARLVHLTEHPEASLIFVEHEGYRFLDPVDEMLFRVGR